MLSERMKSLLRIQFEHKLYEIVSDTFCKHGLDAALFLLKEAPTTVSRLANRYENEFESILLSEQERNGY